MKVIHAHEGFYTLNFERGDEVMTGLAAFAQENGIRAAHLGGLGAAAHLVLAYYNLDTKEYERQVLDENVEILSLQGNIGVKESGETVVHLHGTFGRRDLSVFGGHVFELVISGAGEVHLASFPGTVNRAYDEATGLTLMCPAAPGAEL